MNGNSLSRVKVSHMRWYFFLTSKTFLQDIKKSLFSQQYKSGQLNLGEVGSVLNTTKDLNVLYLASRRKAIDRVGHKGMEDRLLTINQITNYINISR